MKHLKTYEISNQYSDDGDKMEDIEEFKPGYIYYDTRLKIDLCFICDNGTGYPLTCLLFRENRQHYFEFIEWARWMTFLPLNITLKDYILKKDIAEKTLISFKKKHFSSGPDENGNSKKMINKLNKQLLADDDIKSSVDAKKYGI